MRHLLQRDSQRLPAAAATRIVARRMIEAGQGTRDIFGQTGIM
jgi:hypothetical protein